MKAFRIATIVGSLLGGTLLFGGSASAQINLPQPGLPGSSPEQAVRIRAANDLMVDRVIQRWLRTHYPGWDADPIEYQEIGSERYAVVYITARNYPARRVYFRVQGQMNDPDDDGGLFPL